MKTSTVIVIGVVGLAVAGGVVYFATRKRPAAPTRATSSGSGGIAGVVSAAIPLVSKITSYFSSSSSSASNATTYAVDQHDDAVLDSESGLAFSDG